jgi:hypothetical protein
MPYKTVVAKKSTKNKFPQLKTNAPNWKTAYNPFELEMCYIFGGLTDWGEV